MNPIFYFASISLAIVEMVIGFQNIHTDSICSSHFVVFGLSSWLAFGGMVNFIIVSILYCGTILFVCYEHSSTKEKSLEKFNIKFAYPTWVLYGLFLIVWVIIGVTIILSTSVSKCKNELNSVWKMSILSFVFRTTEALSNIIFYSVKIKLFMKKIERKNEKKQNEISASSSNTAFSWKTEEESEYTSSSSYLTSFSSHSHDISLETESHSA